MFDGGPGWFGHLCNKRPFRLNRSILACAMECAYKCTYESIVNFRITLQYEARSKGVSERSELTPCIIYYTL